MPRLEKLDDRRDGAALLLTSLGYAFGSVEYLAGGRYGPVRRTFVTLYTVTLGRVRVIVDERRVVTLEAGESVLLHNRHSIAYDYALGLHTRAAWVETQPSLDGRTLEALCAPFSTPLRASPRLLALLEMGLELQDMAQPRCNQLRNALGAAALAAQLFEASDAPVGDSVPAVARLALRYLQAHCIEMAGLHELAEHVGVSEQHLITTFRRAFGITPIRYLWRLRVLRGVARLRGGDESVAVIAAECGFQNPYHFSRQVKALTGVAPTALRRRDDFQLASSCLPGGTEIHF